jgi:hypothetical protein
MAWNNDDPWVWLSVGGVQASGNGRDCSQLWQIIEEMREVGDQLNRLKVIKISRDQNVLAHELAQFAIKSRMSQCSFACFQSGLSHSLVRIFLKIQLTFDHKKKYWDWCNKWLPACKWYMSCCVDCRSLLGNLKKRKHSVLWRACYN